MKKYSICPSCQIVSPPLTLKLLDPDKYIDENSIPETRGYELICLACSSALEKFEIDNTMIALKRLRDEMDKLYGKSITLPIWLVDRPDDLFFGSKD